MIGKRRYGRPGTSDVIKMIVVNLIIASVTLLVVFKIFGMGIAIGQLPIGEDKNAREIMWTLYSFILPGAGIGFALLWFWLILTGRTVKGLNWGAAYVYGGAVGLFCLPLGSFFTGLLLGDPFIAVLLALLSLVMVPSIALSMVTFGLIMGGINAKMAHKWIGEHRSAGAE